MYKAKITLDLTFSQFVQAKNYLDDAVPYYIYESNGFTTCYVFGETIQEILTHSIFNSFSDILEVSITYEEEYDNT